MLSDVPSLRTAPSTSTLTVNVHVGAGRLVEAAVVHLAVVHPRVTQVDVLEQQLAAGSAGCVRAPNGDAFRGLYVC